MGKESIIIPFVASCPVGLCPTNLVEDVEEDTDESNDQNETEDNN
jgi:hypothetical protein